jgi:hypothetical protein
VPLVPRLANLKAKDEKSIVPIIKNTIKITISPETPAGEDKERSELFDILALVFNPILQSFCQ